MTRNHTPAVRVLGGYLWPIESVVDRPEVALSRWRLYEISSAFSEAPTLHLVGWASETTQGQVSSPVHHVDPVSRRCVTRSGRRYRLIGAPGHCDDAAFIWGAWKQLNGAKEVRDLTDVLSLLLEGATPGGHGE